MRRIYLIAFLTVAVACKNEKNKTDGNIPIDATVEANEIVDPSIDLLTHPLIFEELGLKIVSFKSKETSPNDFEFTIITEPIDLDKFSKDHFFFIHAFDFMEASDKFINMDTRDGILVDNQLVFKRASFKTDIYDYKEIRFGLIDRKNKNRYFVRTIKNVSIKE